MSLSEQAIFTVSQLNTLAKDILESSFPNILVEGEMADLAQPGSGHIYFTLKDNKAQIRVALFAGQKRLLKFQPKNGQQVLVKGRLSLFAPRGDYQLIASHMEEAGEGALRREFELLKQKLANLGWFDDARKKTLPLFCKHVAVITSPSGAAIRDIVHVLERRFPLMQVTIIPSLVQGKQAAQDLVKAIAKANTLQSSGDERFNFEVLLLARGGGSLEDLWPFNEEAVAEAIFNSQLPVICGVGHETDYTIADWVADYRAPTPSAAAETISMDQQTIAGYLENSLDALKQSICALLQQKQNKLHYISKANVDPRRRLQEQFQRLDFLEQRLRNQLNNFIQKQEQVLKIQQARLAGTHPLQKIRHLVFKNEQLCKNLVSAMQGYYANSAQNLVLQSQRLHSVSPLTTLERGFSIASIRSISQEKIIISKAAQVKIDDTLYTELQDAIVESTVKNIHAK